MDDPQAWAPPWSGLCDALYESSMDFNLVGLETIGSTNDLGRFVLAQAFRDEAPAQPSLLVAHEQTGARGRRGNSWCSDAGLGIYASIVMTRSLARRGLAGLPVRVAVALADELSKVAPDDDVRLKWPNDLMCRGRKLGGILIEALAASDKTGLVIGFGINVAHQATQLPLPSAISLRLLGATSVRGAQARVRLLESLATAVLEATDDLGPSGVARYRQLVTHEPGEPMRIRLPDEVVEGTFQGVTDEGHLLLLEAGRDRVISSGESLEFPPPEISSDDRKSP